MSTSENKKSEDLLSGCEIKRLREDLRINQADFADEIGVDRSYLSQIENEKIEPAEKLLRRISNILKQKLTLRENAGEYKGGDSLSALGDHLQKSLADWTSRTGMKPVDFIAQCLIRHGAETARELNSDPAERVADALAKDVTDEELARQQRREPPGATGSPIARTASPPATAPADQEKKP